MKYNSQNIIEQYWNSQSEQLRILENCISSGTELNRNIIEITDKFQKTELEVFSSVLSSQNSIMGMFGNSSGAAVRKENAVFEDSVIKKYRVEITENHDSKEDKSILDRTRGTVIVAGENDAYSEAVMEFIRKKGFKPVRSERVYTEDEAGKYFNENPDVCGIIFSGRAVARDDIVSAFLMCKMFRVLKNESVSAPFIIFTAFMGGENVTDSISAGAFSGMAKTLAQELSGFAVKFTDFEYNISPEKFISELDDELYYKNTETERNNGNRYGLTVKMQSGKSCTDSMPELNSDDVIVVSGGARGVTGRCVTELSRFVNCGIVLLGRTELSDENMDSDETAGLKSINELKAYFANLWKKQGIKFSLRDAEKKAKAVMNTRSVLETIKNISENGCRVYYYQCDISDRDQLREVMKMISDEAGTVTGIIHGAGVLRDSVIEKKSAESFSLVFDTKYRGLTDLVDCTEKDKLKLLVTFSSIAGLFGNYGQIDYASGNSFMDRYVRRFAEKYPECRSVSFNWNAWDGGMVDAAYSKALKSRGVVLIPYDTGAKYFVSEIMHGDSHQVLISNEIKRFSGE